jgi:hypothetical protein
LLRFTNIKRKLKLFQDVLELEQIQEKRQSNKQ